MKTNQTDDVLVGWLDAVREGYADGLCLAALVFVDGEAGEAHIFTNRAFESVALAEALRSAADQTIELMSDHTGQWLH